MISTENDVQVKHRQFMQKDRWFFECKLELNRSDWSSRSRSHESIAVRIGVAKVSKRKHEDFSLQAINVKERYEIDDIASASK